MALQITYYILSILGIVKKKSKLLTALMLFVMWLVYGLCTYNGDFAVYRTIYDNIQNPIYWSEFEPLFNVMMYVCSLCELSFIQFRMIFGAIFLLLLNYTIGKYTVNKAEVLGLYMVFPYLWGTSVIRSAFAGILVMLAYHYVIAGKKEKKMFWILMITATLIQFTSIFFVAYFFLRSKKIRSSLVFITATISIVGVVGYYAGLFYRIASLLTSNYRKLKWFDPANSSQKLKWSVYLIIILLLVIYLCYKARKDSHRYEIGLGFINKYADDVFYLSLTMLVLVPTFFATNASNRFIWQFLLFCFVVYAKNDESRLYTDKWNVLSISIRRGNLVLIALLIFFAYYSNLPYRGTINDGYLAFQNNLIYGQYDWDTWRQWYRANQLSQSR